MHSTITVVYKLDGDVILMHFVSLLGAIFFFFFFSMIFSQCNPFKTYINNIINGKPNVSHPFKKFQDENYEDKTYIMPEPISWKLPSSQTLIYIPYLLN